MPGMKIACFGTNGHQIFGLVPRLSRARLVGVAGCPAERLAELKVKHPEAFADAAHFEGLGELLARSGAELVSICSARRDSQHEDVVRALEAGLHVYAEKPLATTASGLEVIRAAAGRSGREVRSMTGMVYSPVFREMRRLVETGELGRVVQVFAQKSYPYRDRRPQDVGTDGGLIQQAGVHAVSFVRYVTGLEFEELFARDTRLGNPKEGDLRMASQISARLTGGALCTILSNYLNPRGIGFWGNDQLRVFGTNGMAEAVDGLTRASVTVGDEKPRPIPIPEGDAVGDAGLLGDYVAHLLDGTEMLLSQEDSLMNTRVVVRAQESADGAGRLAV